MRDGHVATYQHKMALTWILPSVSRRESFYFHLLKKLISGSAQITAMEQVTNQHATTAKRPLTAPDGPACAANAGSTFTGGAAAVCPASLRSFFHDTMVVSPGRSSTVNSCLRHAAAASGTAAAVAGGCGGARAGGAEVTAGAAAAAAGTLAAAAAAGAVEDEEGAATGSSMARLGELGIREVTALDRRT